MQRAAEERETVEQMMRAGIDGPVVTTPDRIVPRLLGVTAYVKSSVGLQLMRQEILGPAAFDDAFRTYVARWAFRHPTPADFFRTIEDVGGRRLDWFWRGWFLENARYDQAIDTVVTRQAGDNRMVIFRLRQPGTWRAATPRALYVHRRQHRGFRRSGRGVEHRHRALNPPLHLRGQDAREAGDRSGAAHPRHHACEQHVGGAGCR